MLSQKSSFIYKILEAPNLKINVLLPYTRITLPKANVAYKKININSPNENKTYQNWLKSVCIGICLFMF